MSPRDHKPETLANFRITYDEHPDPAKLKDLPGRVRILQEGLQSFRGRVVQEYIEKKVLEKKLQTKDIPDIDGLYTDIAVDLKHPSEIAQILNEQVDTALDILKGAEFLKAEYSQESRWGALLFRTVFRRLMHREPPTSGYWNDFTMGSSISLQENRTWNEDHKLAKATDSGSKLSDPRPDMYLGFRIYNLPYEEPRGFWRDGFVQNFSIDMLGILLNKGLVCTPTTGVRKYLHRRGERRLKNEKIENDEPTTIDSGIEGEPKFSKEHLLCFPWAVVELKHQSVPPSEITNCYCQGANGAARALRMYETLSRYSDIVDGEQIPPVVVLTFIGPVFKLWVAFSTLDSARNYNYKMICIEEQSIATFWGALRLCQIVNDMSFWADRILKPKVSVYIDQWRSRHMHGLRVDLSRDSLLSDVVQKVEQREKDLGLPRTSNLVEIVRLALIISEIPSAKEDTKSKEDINPQTKQPGIPVNKPVTPVSYSRTEEIAIQSTTDRTDSHYFYQKTPSGTEHTMTPIFMTEPQKSNTKPRKYNTKLRNSKSSTNTPVAQKNTNDFALGGSVPQNVAFGGTGNMGRTPSSSSGVFDFEATLGSWSLSTPSPTPPSKSNPIAKESLAINGERVDGTSIAKGGDIPFGDARTKPSTKKHESIFGKFLDKGSQKTSNLEESSSDGVYYKVSRLGISVEHQGVNPGENTKGRRAGGPHSGPESDDDERLSMIVEDTLLFLWPEA